MSYTRVGQIGRECRNLLIEQVPELITNEGHDVYEGSAGLHLEPLQHPDLLAIWTKERWLRAFVIRIPPDGYMLPHSHHDTDHVKYHVVLETNTDCMSHNGGAGKHLSLGGVYRMSPSQTHESYNRGSTSRTHLVVQIIE